MNVTTRNINEIKPYEANPRINDDAVDAVAASLKEFGFRQPIVVDGDGVIIVGHTRWKAAMKLGLAKVPVHVAKDLSPEQIKAYRIADNKTGELAEWDFDLLPIELKDLQQADYDLNLLGFDADELAHLLDGDVAEGLTDPDSVPEPPDDPITQPGDLWVVRCVRRLLHLSGAIRFARKERDQSRCSASGSLPGHAVGVIRRCEARKGADFGQVSDHDLIGVTKWESRKAKQRTPEQRCPTCAPLSLPTGTPLIGARWTSPFGVSRPES